VRLSLPLEKPSFVYFEVTVVSGGSCIIGIAEKNWSPLADGVVGSDDRSFGLDGSKGTTNNVVVKNHGKLWGKDSIVGVLIDFTPIQNSAQRVSFTIDGVECGSDSTLNSIADWVFTGLVPVVTIGPGQSISINIGRKQFSYSPPIKYNSLLSHIETFSRSHNNLSQPVEKWEIDSNQWSVVMPDHDMWESDVDRNVDSRTKRVRAVSWLLFVETMARSNGYYHMPYVIESDHPNRLNHLEEVVRYPGATTLNIACEVLKFSKSVGVREVIQFFDSEHNTHYAKKLSGNDSLEAFTIISDFTKIVWNSSVDKYSMANYSPGWGYRFKIQPSYSEPAIMSQSGKSSNSNGRIVTEKSLHNYLDNTNIVEHVEIKGAEAIKIVFDSRSVTEANNDYISFYFDAACTKNVPRGEKFSGVEFPGMGSTPPLVITGSEFWYKFYSDGSVNCWGYEFDCISTVSRMTELMDSPGAVRIQTDHPYDGSDFVSKVSVKGRYHATVEFSDLSEFCSEDKLEFYMTDPSLGEAPPYKVFEGSCPLHPVTIPTATFWIKLSSSNSYSTRYGFECVAYRSYDLFTAILSSPNAKVTETMHPYEDSMNQVYQIDISAFPIVDGYRKVSVVFDKLSSTESSYDYLSFYSYNPEEDPVKSLPESTTHSAHSHELAKAQDPQENMTCDVCHESAKGWIYHCNECNFFAHTTCIFPDFEKRYGLEKYSGGRNQTQKNFPFVDTPLSIDHVGGSFIYAKFVSDGSNNDWGVKFVVYDPNQVPSYDAALDVEVEDTSSALSHHTDESLMSTLHNKSFFENHILDLIRFCHDDDIRTREFGANILCNCALAGLKVSEELVDVVKHMFSDCSTWIQSVAIDVGSTSFKNE
jgi:hypothetical protein